MRFRKLLSVYVYTSFLLGFKGGICNLVVLVPDHCLSLSLYVELHLGINEISTYIFRRCAKRLPDK